MANFGLVGLPGQAYDQGALLSYDDLAMFLTTNLSTIKRAVQQPQRESQFIMTRGAKLDMRLALSHKSIIMDYYFKGHTFTDIERITNHFETSIKHYLADFLQVASLHQQNLPPAQIRLITQKSDRIVLKYIGLFDCFIVSKTMSVSVNCCPRNHPE